jgi:hypothetical protein
VTIPEVEVLSAQGSLGNRVAYGRSPSEMNVVSSTLRFQLSLYLIPREISRTTVIPFHRCRCRVASLANAQALSEFDISMSVPSAIVATFGLAGSQPDSLTIAGTNSEIILRGPGKCYLSAEMTIETPVPSWLLNNEIEVTFQMSVVDSPIPVLLHATAKPQAGESSTQVTWELEMDQA